MIKLKLRKNKETVLKNATMPVVYHTPPYVAEKAPVESACEGSTNDNLFIMS